VEISAPNPAVHALVRPWRTMAILASGIAALELLILLGLATASLGKSLSSHAKEAAISRATGIPAPEIRPEPKRATLARGETSVIVLNGNGVGGAAAATAARVKAKGYAVGATGNACVL
jgi:hypothetical protein